MGYGWVGTAAKIYSQWQKGQDDKDRADDQADYLKKIAKHNAELSLLDAHAAEKDARAAETAYGWRLKRHLENVDKVIGRAKVQIGKSGVALSGSALDSVVESARTGAEDAALITQEGKSTYERGMDVAKRYRLMAKYGLRDAAYQASLLERAGQDQANYGNYAAMATAAQGFYDYGETEGWWD